MTPRDTASSSAPSSRFALGLAVCGTALVLGLAVGVHAGIFDPLDAAVSGWVASLRSSWSITAFKAITAMGADGALTAMTLVATAPLATLSRRGRLVPLWVAFLGTEASTYGLKYLVDRVRPPVLSGVGQALTPSFPSAHSAGTAIVVGMLAAIIAAEQPPGPGRRAILCGAAGIVLLIGFSRVFLNLHFFSDVVGGFLVALVWLAIGTRLLARDPR